MTAAVALAPRPSFWRFVVDRNPFYLLSAVCMFAGCRVIIAALGVSPGDLNKLVGLITVLNVYEALLIALALFLIRCRGLNRDGWILLSIEALFLVDLTLLNAEVFTANLRRGLLVNAACFGLALVKIGIVVRVLRLRVPWPRLAVIAVQLAALFGMAGMFKHLAKEGTLSAGVLYGAWWAVALIPVLWSMALRRTGDRSIDAGGFAPLPYRLYGLVPFISLLVHLCGANRVYWMHFNLANVAPVLLGAAVLVGRSRRMSAFGMANLQMALAAVSVLISLSFPGDLTFDSLGVHWTPLRLALAGAAGVSLHCLWLHNRWAFASMATACVATASLGPDVDQMRENIFAFVRWVVECVGRMVPTTPLEWGITAVVASFVLLALGAVISLRKGAPQPEPSDGEG